MNFLELCQAMIQDSPISGQILSVSDQTGELKRVVGWIAKAYRKVQLKHSDWEFLRRDVSFATSATKANYTATEAGLTDFGEWTFATQWRAYTTALGVADEQPVRFMAYNKFKQRYAYASARLDTGRPQVVTVKPDESLLFWPIPNAIFTIVGEQYRAPHELVANSDAPIFATKFHDVIVERALMLYGEYSGDATVFASAQGECARTLSKMEEVYMPEWEEAGSLA